MIHSASSKLVLATLLLAAAAAAARANVAVDTFGAGDSYDSGSGYVISTSTSVFGAAYYDAQQFTSATTGGATAVTFAASLVGGSGRVQLGIYEDSGADGVGALLGSASVVTIGGAAAIYSYSANGVSLAAGGKYWLGMEALDDTAVFWQYSQPVVTGRFAAQYESQNSSIDGYTLSAFRVETQAVPEPASLAVLGLGAALLRRRKRA